MPNHCILTGNLGKDPDVFYSSDGKPVTTFSLAFQGSRKKTGWIKVTCFQKLAEIASKYLHKGAKIIVTGILDQSTWGKDPANQRTTLQIIAGSLEFIKTDGRGFDNGKPSDDNIPF